MEPRSITSPTHVADEHIPEPTAADDESAAAVVNGVRRITKAIELYSRAVQRDFGLTGAQLWAMRVLASRPHSTGELARALAVHQSSASVLVQRLVKRGLVRRRRDRHDRRIVRLSLSDEGAALVGRAPEPAQGRLLDQLRSLDPDELIAIASAVERIVGLMDAADLSAPFFFDS